MKKINKILIANRGEIAVRIMKTCKLMGIKTVSLYTSGEKDYPHALYADDGVCLGEGEISKTYLNEDRIIEIARKMAVDAIHPGYGLFAENPKFCLKVEKAGMIFIGPKAKTMELMGDKRESKKEVMKMGIPVVPGYQGEKQDAQFLKKEAEKIGYPLLIKAAAGGGGKGMRIVKEESAFLDALSQAKREAKGAFLDDSILLEKLITNPRHIEVQVFSDSKGNHLHLFERECSIQRRHQKIIEETPACLDEPLCQKITESAVAIARGIDYLGAGTIEFLLDKDRFYFLEMNTRLQVEHPVTEMVTGLDLVALQIDVAQEKELPFKQQDIISRGHAMEVRLCAEDPDNEFLPTAGRIEYLGRPDLPFTRFDVGVASTNTIITEFDSLLGKLIAWGRNREEAIRRLELSLDKVCFMGIKNNRGYLQRILRSNAFLNGDIHTGFVEHNKKILEATLPSLAEEALSLAAHLFSNKESSLKDDGESPWNYLSEYYL